MRWEDESAGWRGLYSSCARFYQWHYPLHTVSEEQGFTYENIQLEVRKGRIVKASANDADRINALLDTDEGGRYFGEFAIGVNSYILHPMKDTLFDEKICGSFHLTPGAA